MAMRMSTAAFSAMALDELEIWLAGPNYTAKLNRGLTITVDPAPYPMAHVSGYPDTPGVIVLHKKPILALIDTESAAREIVRNLIRWGLEQ